MTSWMLLVGIVKYKDYNFGFRRMGKGRYSLDIYKIALRFEFIDYR